MAIAAVLAPVATYGSADPSAFKLPVTIYYGKVLVLDASFLGDGAPWTVAPRAAKTKMLYIYFFYLFLKINYKK